MVQIHNRVKFPCGFEIESNTKTGWLDMFFAENKEVVECPLHKKNCPPKN